MIKILFIKAQNITKDNFSIVPPLGLMYLASVLREKDNFEIKIVDTRLRKYGESEIRSEVKNFKPDIVGVSAISFESQSMHFIAKSVKKENKNIVVLCGGPHPSIAYDIVLRDENIDYVVIGEGEANIYNIIKSISAGKKPYEVKGVAFRDNGTIYTNLPGSFVRDLDELPYPAWDLIDLNRYSVFKSMGTTGRKKYGIIVTSRGCPYRCIFCHNMHGKVYRYRTPENVIEEIGMLKKYYDIRKLEIIDDIFNLLNERSKEILSLIIKNNINVEICFPNGLRGDLIDKEFIDIMKRAGTSYVSIAIETASERLQRYIGKNLDLKKTKEVIEMLYEAGIYSNGFFMLGFPTETREEMISTIRYAVDSKLTQAMFFRVIPFIGTKMYESIDKSKIKNDWEKHDYFVSSYNLSEVDEFEIGKMIRKAYRSFYLSPCRLIGIIKNNSDYIQLLRLALLTLKRMY